MLEKSNTWPEQVLDTLNSCWRALLESCSNTQANVRRDPLLPARGSGSGWRRASGTAASAAPPGDSGAAARARGAAEASTEADAGAPESHLGLWLGLWSPPHRAPASHHARERWSHRVGHISGARVELGMLSGHLFAAGVAHAAHISRHRGHPCREQTWQHGRGRLPCSF